VDASSIRAAFDRERDFPSATVTATVVAWCPDLSVAATEQEDDRGVVRMVMDDWPSGHEVSGPIGAAAISVEEVAEETAADELTEVLRREAAADEEAL